jgi:hypothetical protein
LARRESLSREGFDVLLEPPPQATVIAAGSLMTCRLPQQFANT